MNALPIVCFLVGVAMVGANGANLVSNAPAGAAKKRNPLEGDENAKRAGARLYTRECASCHGSGRQGLGNAPPLNQPGVSEAAPGALFWVLRNGSLHRGMPSFAHLPEAQRWQIITFLRTGTK